MRTRRTAANLATCSALLASMGAECEPPPEPPPVVMGLADVHNHMFAHLAFGGMLLTHDTDPTTGCRPPLPATAALRLPELVKHELAGEATEQAAEGRCEPTPWNFSGQQVDTSNLERAWRYGLRLLVVDAVNSEFLCAATEIGPCDDLPTIDAQLAAAHALEASIDEASGGPGTGWFRIVTSPAQARTVITEGKLAVVLGVEASNAYGGCRIVADGTTDPIVFWEPQQTLWRLDCSEIGPGVDHGFSSMAVARLEHAYDQGARHFFLVHHVPGIAGGNALFNPMLHGTNNPVQRGPGALVDLVPDFNRVILEARLPFTSWNCASAGYTFDGGVCNAEGLSPVGLDLARAMTSYGVMIDIDHLSLRAKRALRGPDGISAYPLVSSHGGFDAINAGFENNEHRLTPSEVTDVISSGGAFAPMLHQSSRPGDVSTFPAGDTTVPLTCPGTSESWVQAYRYAVLALSTGQKLDGSPAYVGVGMGSDFNGFAGWPRPRFDPGGTVTGEMNWLWGFVGQPLEPAGGLCYLAAGGVPPADVPHVTYPFSSPMTGETFDRSVIPWSGRTYDISFDGVAHVGMIPDFVEEMRALGLTDAELDPLWHGAEAFLQTWEASEAWRGTFGTEEARGIHEDCRAARAPLADASGTPEDVTARWLDALSAIETLGCDYREG